MNRQDDLLQRLKSCVGQIQTKPYESIHQVRQLIQPSSSKGSHQEDFDSSVRSSKKKYELNLNDYKQNQRQNDLHKNKKAFEALQNNPKHYWTDRKMSLPLTQVTNISTLKKNNLHNQLQEPTSFLGSKNVTESTKKRIQERASLIQQDLHNITPRKSFSKQTAKDIHSKLSFDTKIQVKDQQKFLNQEKLNQITKALGKTVLKKEIEMQTLLERGKLKTKDLIVDNQVPIPSKNYEMLKKIKSQKLDNYSKFSIQNFVKENDFRKTQKLQKLKKITQINEAINNRIRKLVDNFQNYLSHPVAP